MHATSSSESTRSTIRDIPTAARVHRCIQPPPARHPVTDHPIRARCSTSSTRRHRPARSRTGGRLSLTLSCYDPGSTAPHAGVATMLLGPAVLRAAEFPIQPDCSAGWWGTFGHGYAVKEIFFTLQARAGRAGLRHVLSLCGCNLWTTRGRLPSGHLPVCDPISSGPMGRGAGSLRQPPTWPMRDPHLADDGDARARRYVFLPGRPTLTRLSRDRRAARARIRDRRRDQRDQSGSRRVDWICVSPKAVQHGAATGDELKLVFPRRAMPDRYPRLDSRTSCCIRWTVPTATPTTRRAGNIACAIRAGRSPANPQVSWTFRDGPTMNGYTTASTTPRLRGKASSCPPRRARRLAFVAHARHVAVIWRANGAAETTLVAVHRPPCPRGHPRP